MSDYVPFGQEWEQETMKCPKKYIVRMLRDALTKPRLPWRKVSEKRPEQGRIVAVLREYRILSGIWHHDDGFRDDETHWCYLDELKPED